MLNVILLNEMSRDMQALAVFMDSINSIYVLIIVLVTVTSWSTLLSQQRALQIRLLSLTNYISH